MNPRWHRWITASTAAHFKNVADSLGIHFHIESDLRKTQEHPVSMEYRIDGPHSTWLRFNLHRLDVVINIGFSITDNNNIYEPQDLAGSIAEAMTDICVYKLGPDPGDDNTLLGQLQREGGIRVNHFGQIRSDTPLIQGTVSGKYFIHLKN